MKSESEERRPTRAEAIQAAGEVYGAILADPERREQLRQARAIRAQATEAGERE